MYRIPLAIYLAHWTIMSNLAATQSTPENRPTLPILYLSDSPLTTNKKELFDAFLKKLSNSTGEDKAVELRAQEIPKNSSTMLPILTVLNSSLPWGETGIIILDVDHDKMKTLSLFSKFSLVFDVKTRPLTENKLYSRTLTAKPSRTRLHEAVKHIFGEIGWTTMAEVECPTQTYNDIKLMKSTLDTIRQSTFTFIFIKCLHNLDIVLRYAKEIGLTSNVYRWVFPGLTNLEDISEFLPKNVIGIDLPGVKYRAKTNEDNMVFLSDVLKVLEIILAENAQNDSNEWSSKRFTKILKRHIVNRVFPGSTGDVIFDEEGRRRGESYRIFELITFNGKHEWLPIGSLERGNVKILFNQWRLDRGPTDEIPVLRVVTLYAYPWVVDASENHPEPSGECVVGRRCRSYTNESGHIEEDEHCCIGLVIDLLQRLESDTRFRGVVHIVKDGSYGARDAKTRKWNGMVGEIVRGEADMAVAPLTITAKRSEVVDFTYPYLDAAYGIMVSTDPAIHTLWDFVFLNTFSFSLWLALFVTIQVVIVILWLAERLRKRRRFVNDPYKRDDSISYAEIINYTWSLVFQKASEEVGPSTLGGRTVAALFGFCTIILCSSFTANLAAIQVSERAGISISGIYDSKFQHPTSGFKFGTLNNSAGLDFFRYSNDSVIQRIYKHLKNNLVSNTKEGTEKVASREWAAYMDDIPQLNYFTSKKSDCTLKVVGDPFFFSGYGVALPLNSSWNAPLSLAITELVRVGFIRELQSKWLISACDNSQRETGKMGVNDIGGVFLIVAFGCVTSVVLLGVEFAVWRLMEAVTKDTVEENPKLKRSQTLTTLAKAFSLWDINQTGKPVLHAEAMLRNFRAFPQQDHGYTNNIDIQD